MANQPRRHTRDCRPSIRQVLISHEERPQRERARERGPKKRRGEHSYLKLPPTTAIVMFTSMANSKSCLNSVKMHLAMTGCFQTRILRLYVKKMNEIYESHRGQVYKDSHLQQTGKKRASQHQWVAVFWEGKWGQFYAWGACSLAAILLPSGLTLTVLVGLHGLSSLFLMSEGLGEPKSFLNTKSYA